ncbi:MAG: UDPglucose--hexose-1-phosphate uridylyltransferase, partial [Candidatus Omnitrophota bacterium]
MSEYRRDPITSRWVIVNTDTPWQPDHYPADNNEVPSLEFSPFIYGREHLTPPEIDAIHAENSSDWLTRVIPNKFPALGIEGDLDPVDKGMYYLTNGIGAHEVLIETPDPVQQMCDHSDEQMFNIFSMYQRRYIDLAKDTRFKYLSIFKNFGHSAGASIYHAHSQLIALPMVPINVLDQIIGVKNYENSKGRNVYQDIL